MKSVLIEALLEKARRLCRESTTRDVEFKKVLQLCMCAYQQDPNSFFYMLYIYIYIFFFLFFFFWGEYMLWYSNFFFW